MENKTQSFKQNLFYSNSGDVINNYSKISKATENKIHVNKGIVIIYKPRKTRGVPFEVISESQSDVTDSTLMSGGSYRKICAVPELEDQEINESSSLYVKIPFSCDSGFGGDDMGTLIDFGLLDGSKDTNPDFITHFGLLSEKKYTFSSTEIIYEIHPDSSPPEDSDDEGQISAGNGSYSGYFYIKIATLPFSDGSVQIQQHHFGPIEITEPIIYFDAFSLTEF